MAGKLSLTVAAASMLIAGAFSQSCPDSGVGVGREQLCSFSGKATICGEILGYITTPGTSNMAATKSDDGTSSESCGSYSNGASVDCDGDTITGIYPPDAGYYTCTSANIVQPGGFGSFAVIVACCQPS